MLILKVFSFGSEFELAAKSETLELRILYHLLEIGYFRKHVFGLNLNILSTCAYTFVLLLLNMKKS